MCAISWSKSFLFSVQISRHLVLLGTLSVSGNQRHQPFFFTWVSQAAGDSKVIFVFRLYSTVWEKLVVTFFAQCGWNTALSNRVSEAEETVLNILVSILFLLLSNQIVRASFSCCSLCSWMVYSVAAICGFYFGTELVAAHKDIRFIVCLWPLGVPLSCSASQPALMSLFNAVPFSSIPPPCFSSWSSL